MIYTPFIWPLVIAIVIVALLEFYARRFRHVPATGVFRVLMGLSALYILLTALGISTTALSLRVVLFLLIFIPTPFIPPMILILAIEYVGRGDWLSPKRLGLLFLIPVLSLLAALTSNYHTLFRYDFQMSLAGPLPVLLAARGPWYWIHVIYSESMMLIALGLWIRSFRKPSLRFQNTLLLILGILIPSLVDLLFQFGITPIRGYNLSVSLYALTGLLYAWALLRGRLFNVVPLAREMVMENVDDLVIVVDPQNQLVDFNHSAQTACQVTARSIGEPLDQALPPTWVALFQKYRNVTATKEQVAVDSDPSPRIYDLTISSIADKQRHIQGRVFLLHDITEYKNKERALQESEEKYRNLVEHANDGIVIIQDGKIQYANQRAAQIWGGGTEELVNTSFTEHIHPDALDKVIESYQKRISGQATPSIYQASLKKKTSHLIDVELNASIITFRDRPADMVIIRDITAHKQAEALVSQQSQQLRLLYDASQRLNRTLDLTEIYQTICDFMSLIAPNDGLFISTFDSDTQLITCRAYWMQNKWLDVSPFPSIPLEAEGKGTQSVVIRTGQSMLVGDYQAMIKSAQRVYYVDDETNLVAEGTPEDEEVTRSATIVPLKVEDRVIGVIQVMSYRLNAYTENQLKLFEALALHIASAEQNARLYTQVQTELRERKLAEEALRKSETHYRTLIENVGEGIGFVNAQDQFTFANPAGENIFGVPPGGLTNRSLSEFSTPEQFDLMREQTRLRAVGETSIYEVQIRQPNGDRRDLLVTAVPEFDSQSKFVGTFGVFRDITERKHAEAALREYNERLEREVKQRTQELEQELAQRQVADLARRKSEAYVRNIFDSSLDMIITLDNDQRIVEFNRAAQETFGYTPQQVIGKPVHILNADPETGKRIYQVVNAHDTFSGEIANIRKNGEVFYSLLSSGIMRDALGNRIGFVSVSRDITEQRQINQALRASEEKFRSIVEVSRDAISLCDEQGMVIEWNNGAEEITGLLRADVLGKPIWDVQFQMIDPNSQTPDVYAMMRSANQQLLATGISPNIGQRQERDICPKDKTPRTVSTIISPIQTPRGYMVSSVTRDITDRKQMEMVLRQAKDELEQRVKERTTELEQANTELEAQNAQRQLAQAALAEETERLALTLRSIGDAVITTDRAERIVLFNPIAEQLTGWSSDQAIGQPLSNVFCLINAQTRQPSPSPVSQVLEKGASTGLLPDTALVSNDGKTYMLSASVAPIRDNVGAITGAVLAFRDITLIHKAERALQDARAAEAASRAKSQFLAHMSHEIRTPIHGITGVTTLLGNTALDSEQQEYLSMIKSSAEALLDTVNDILDFSKIEAGKIDLEQIDFDLINVVEHAMDLPALRARKKGIELVCRIAPDVPTRLIGDAMRLRQILVNLIGNAVKFTEQGEIIVTVENEPGARMLHLSVRDTGIGIAADKCQVIFESFRQSDDSTARQYGGSGLGLAIAQKLVELMNGRIWVESRIGQGSAFHFTIELHTQPQTAPALRPDPAWQDALGLVIDDNAASRAMLTELLGSWGFRVTSAPHALAGLQAIETAREQNAPFRIILLDSKMPKMDGFSAAEWFRDDASARQATVMLLCSDDVHSDLRRCQDLGIMFHLIKPIKPTELYGIVQAVLNPKVEPARALDQALPIPTNVFADRITRVLFVEDNVVNQIVGKKLLEQKGFVVQLARNGKEAVNLHAAETYDLILMDVEMPEMDGLEATRVIRHTELGSGKHISIIAMTAYGSKENREACLQAGMDSYLAKPFTPAKLEEAMMPFATRASAPASCAAPRIDRHAALEAVGGSEEFLHQAIKELVDQDYGRHCASIVDGLARNDAETIRKAAHGLKGAFSTFGGFAACETAHQIELAAKANNLTAIPELFAQLQGAMPVFQG